MKRLVVIALVLVTGGSTYVVTRTLERKERERIERWGGDAEMRAVRAEKRAEGYRRLSGDRTPLSTTEVPGSPSMPAALANAVFPFDGQVGDLVKQLALDETQAQQLRGIYMKRWETVKQLAGAAVVPAGLAVKPVSTEAAAFLSPAQLKKLQQIESEQQTVSAPGLAEGQARQMEAALGLSEEQTLRVADALSALYRAPAPAAGAPGSVEQVKRKLRPILTEEQWKSLVASLEDRDPPASPAAVPR